MKYRILPFFLLSICLIAIKNYSLEESVEQTNYPEFLPTDPSGNPLIFRIPVGDNLYRSPQLTYQQIYEVKESVLLTTVIRLNGNGKNDADIMTIEQEKEAWGDNIEFIHINLHKEGYVKGKGYLPAAEQISEIMTDPDRSVLIHCRNDAHRGPTGIAYLLLQKGWPREHIKKYLKWEGENFQPGGIYYKYAEILNN